MAEVSWREMLWRSRRVIFLAFRALEGDRLNLFGFNPDPTVRHTFLTQVIGGLFIFLSIYAVNQVTFLEYLSQN